MVYSAIRFFLGSQVPYGFSLARNGFGNYGNNRRPSKCRLSCRRIAFRLIIVDLPRHDVDPDQQSQTGGEMAIRVESALAKRVGDQPEVCVIVFVPA